MTEIAAAPTPSPSPETPTPAPAAPSPSPAPTPEPSLASPPAQLTAADLTVPDGFTLDEATSKSLVDIMNNSFLTPAARANELIKLQSNLAKAASEAGSARVREMVQGWRDETLADPEIGGDKIQSTLSNVNVVMRKFGSDDLRKVFDESGLGNNIHLVRFLSKIGAALGEGAPAASPAPGVGDNNVASLLFPSAKN